MEIDAIERGWIVISEDGKRVGDVVEVHPHYLLVSRGLLVVRDVYVPRYAVATVADRKVTLAITAERLRVMGWNEPPPPPPITVDDSMPHLVPEYEPDPDPYPYASPADDLSGGITFEDPTPGANTYYGTDNFADDVATATAYLDDYEDMGITIGPHLEVESNVYLAIRQLAAPNVDAPPIVLLHGWAVDARVWDYLTLDLPRDATVVTLNARGYGGSSAPWDGYDVPQATRDLRIALRTLEMRDATLVGVDLGALVALNYAATGGLRAARLVLINPIAPLSLTEPDALPQTLRWTDLMRRDRPRLAAELADAWLPDASGETRGWLRGGILDAAPHALLRGLEAITSAASDIQLDAVTLPTIILHGSDDPFVPLSHGRALAAALPSAQLFELELPGHLPMLSDPAAITTAIRNLHAAPRHSGSDTPDDRTNGNQETADDSADRREAADDAADEKHVAVDDGAVTPESLLSETLSPGAQPSEASSPEAPTE